VSDFVISLFNIVRLRIRCKKLFAKGPVSLRRRKEDNRINKQHPTGSVLGATPPSVTKITAEPPEKGGLPNNINRIKSKKEIKPE